MQRKYFSPFQIYSGKDTLVEVFSNTGKLLRGFGKNHIDKNKSYTFLSIDKQRDEIAVAWKYFPKIKVFSTQGELIANIDINHKLMKENSKINQKAKFKNGRIDLFNVIDSFSYFGGELFVFKNFPRIEIQRINLTGEIKRVYWFEPQDGNVGVKIAVQENNEEFIFYIVEIYPENKVLVYSAKK